MERKSTQQTLQPTPQPNPNPHLRPGTPCQSKLPKALQDSYQTFNILQYRLQDLLTFLSAIHTISSTKQFEPHVLTQLKHTINQLYNVCQIFVQHFWLLQEYIDRLVEQIGRRSGKGQGGRRGKEGEDLGKDCKKELYLHKIYANSFKEKIKDVNEKYTKISKQIFGSKQPQKKKKLQKCKTSQFPQKQFPETAKKPNRQIKKDKKPNTANPNLSIDLHSTTVSQRHTQSQFRSSYLLNTSKSRYSQFRNNNRSSLGKDSSTDIRISFVFQNGAQNKKVSKFRQRVGINFGLKNVVTSVNKNAERIKMRNMIKKTMKDSITINQNTNQDLSTTFEKKTRPITLEETINNLQKFEDICLKVHKDTLKMQVPDWNCDYRNKSECVRNQEQSDSSSSISTARNNGIYEQANCQGRDLVSGQTPRKNQSQSHQCASIAKQKSQKASKIRRHKPTFYSVQQLPEQQKQRKKPSQGKNLKKYKKHLSPSFKQLLNNIKKKVKVFRKKNRVIARHSYFLNSSLTSQGFRRNGKLEINHDASRDRGSNGRSTFHEKYNHMEDTIRESQDEYQGLGGCHDQFKGCRTQKRLKDILNPLQLKDSVVGITAVNSLDGFNDQRRRYGPLYSPSSSDNDHTTRKKGYFREQAIQAYKIPREFVVNEVEKQSLRKTVEMNPWLDCSLSKIEKSNERTRQKEEKLLKSLIKLAQSRMQQTHHHPKPIIQKMDKTVENKKVYKDSFHYELFKSLFVKSNLNLLLQKDLS